MSVQYLSDEKGRVTAVQLSIREWEIIKSKYPDIGSDTNLPEWHNEIIDARLKLINEDSNLIKPISALLAEIDK